MHRSFLSLSLIIAGSLGAAPRDSVPLDVPEWPLNYRLHLEGAAKGEAG
jgi:hypothetical protein